MDDQKEEPQVQLTTQQLLQMISDSRADMARNFAESNKRLGEQNSRLEEQNLAIKENQESIK